MIGTLCSIFIFMTTFVVLLWFELYDWALGFLGIVFSIGCILNACKTRTKQYLTHDDVIMIRETYSKDLTHRIDPRDITIIGQPRGESKNESNGEYKGETKGEFKHR